VANSTRGGNGAKNALAPAPTTYSDFAATHPPLFTEAGEPLEVDHWLRVIESKFGLLHCTEVQKTLFTAQQLRGDTSAWWANYTATRPVDYQVSWAKFRNVFRAYYITADMMRKKRQEFMDLKQGERSMHNYSKQFNHLAQYAPDQVDTDEKKKDRSLHDRSLHQATGAHGVQHWRDISRIHQQCHDRGRCNPRPQGNQEEEGCGRSIQ
jgi:hypothetical protein